ncbi:cytochrome oxidase Cu insertion factor (SCO1/SenC/PrrC family) [Nitrobacteraceae bacterium AZCC 1564]
MTMREILAAAALLCCCLTAPSLAQTSPRSAAELMDAVMWNREPIGGPFALTDQTGQQRTDADFRGKLMLIYFGFTYCPDVCPTDLQAIGLAMDKLGANAKNVQPLFITLDPERDTVEHLAEYVPLFHPRLIGLTGSTSAVAQAADAYRVYYKRVNFETTKADYTIDHSAFIYLVDRDGKYLGFFPPGTPAEKIAQMIEPYLKGKDER